MAYNMFLKVGRDLKVDGVKGDSTDAAHEDWIEVMSVSHGISTQQEWSTGLASGKIDLRDLSVTKRVDRASVPLVSKCLNNANIPEITLEICRATGEKTTFMKVVLKYARVASIDLSGSPSAADPLPMEQVSFRYGEIEWTYTDTSPSGEPGDQYEAAHSVMENRVMENE